MSAEERSIAVIDRVRRFLQSDDGDLVIAHLDGAAIQLHQTGRCSGCPSAHMALLPSVEQALRHAVPDFTDIGFTGHAVGLRESRGGRRQDPADNPAIQPGTPPGDDDTVEGTSTRMRALAAFIKVISRSDSTVLLTGESGTGKEVTATMIHRSSRRRARPFVAVSCALFSDTLIESELFGHERGAFTGAIKDRPGRFELAEGGTLFLDDIDDIPLAMQVKLLRVLQNRTIERLGGTRTIPVNVRVIAATKHDLSQMVAGHLFREDLFYRLNVIPITLPPLRERREDIPALTDHFLERSASRRGDGVKPHLPMPVRQAFQQYDWPGNVRELENACERLVQTCFCGSVGAGCLSVDMLPVADAVLPVGLSAEPGDRPFPDSAHDGGPVPIDLDRRLRDFESDLLDWALATAGGNKTKAAGLLKISRSTFGDRLLRSRQPIAGVDPPFHPDDLEERSNDYV